MDITARIHSHIIYAESLLTCSNHSCRIVHDCVIYNREHGFELHGSEVRDNGFYAAIADKVIIKCTHCFHIM